MPMAERDLLRQYGAAVLTHNASLFVGAGMSLGAGYPGWGKLLDDLRTQAGIPEMTDMPLLAQYYVLSTPGGREALNSHILNAMSAISPKTTRGHRLIAKLDIDDIWTTNYDRLLEESMPDARVIAREDDLKIRQIASRQRITKMHGSLNDREPTGWLEEPIITRSDYESYETVHARKWAALRAAYMTRSFLFLGFSFSDPNIEVLLRLSRTLLDVGTAEHFTVLKRPARSDEERMHDLRVRDLETSGIGVHEIDRYEDIIPLLDRLVRRTRKATLFISGSNGTDADSVRNIGKKIGHRLADFEIQLASLAGDAGLAVSFPFGYSLQANSSYSPEQIKFYFRQSGNTPPPLTQRVGTAVYTGSSREEILADVLPECRSALVLGGGDNTMEEVNRARDLELPVIPVPTSGGTALQVYRALRIEELLGSDISASDQRDWANLENPDQDIVASAATRLVRRMMFLTPPS